MREAATLKGAALVIGFVLGSALCAQAANKVSQAECQSIWNRLDSAKSGSLAEAQAKSSVTDFKAVDTNKDGKLSQAEFNAGCDKGLVQSMAITGPSKGTTTPKK